MKLICRQIITWNFSLDLIQFSALSSFRKYCFLIKFMPLPSSINYFALTFPLFLLLPFSLARSFSLTQSWRGVRKEKEIFSFLKRWKLKANFSTSTLMIFLGGRKIHIEYHTHLHCIVCHFFIHSFITSMVKNWFWSLLLALIASNLTYDTWFV